MPLLRSNTLRTNPARPSDHLRRTTSAPARLSHHFYPVLTAPSAEHYWDHEYRAFRDARDSKIRTTTITINFPFVDISVQSPAFSQRANWLDFHAFSLNQERFWNERAQNFILSAIATGRAPTLVEATSGISGLSTIEEVEEDNRETIATRAKALRKFLVILDTASIAAKQKVKHWRYKVAWKGGSVRTRKE